MRGQLSFFTAGELPPAVEDLEGLLAGPGHVVRRAAEARLSIVVGADWRVEALLAAFADRGLTGEATTSLDGRAGARTQFSARLTPLAGRWARGAHLAVPDGWRLDGSRLRLWSIAAGRPDDYGYLLQLAEDEGRWAAVGSALHDAGVPGTLIGPRAGGPAYRITGRRIGRLVELVGPAPPGAGHDAWPGPAT